MLTNITEERLHPQGISKTCSSARARRFRVPPVEEEREYWETCRRHRVGGTCNLQQSMAVLLGPVLRDGEARVLIM